MAHEHEGNMINEFDFDDPVITCDVPAIIDAVREIVFGHDQGVIHSMCGHFYQGEAPTSCDCSDCGEFIPAVVVTYDKIKRLAMLCGISQ